VDFDLDFERSRVYFTILQVLRIFNECIQTVSRDLRALDSLSNPFKTSFNRMIFQKDVDQTTREYKITTVVVSLVTYLVAVISMLVVNRDHIKHKAPL
jgi:hypothetical protein